MHAIMKISIDHLPAEVLLQVFVHVRRFKLFLDDSELWYRLLWVCKRWRTLVLEAPALWATIGINKRMKRNLVEACLTFSKQALLQVDIRDTTTAQNAWIVECLLPHLHRIRRLQIRDMEDTADEALNTLLEKAMPALEELGVGFTSKTRLRGPFELPPLMPFLHEPKDPFVWDLAHEHFPSLRSLFLGSALKVNGSLPVFRRLRKLELSGCLCAPMSISEFAFYLNHLPELEELTVDRFRPEIPVPPATPVLADPFHLPSSLRNFTLKDNYYYTIPFLSSFDLPAHMSVKIVRAQDFFDYGDIEFESYVNGFPMSVLYALSPRRFSWPILEEITSIELRHFLSSCFMIIGSTPDGRTLELVGIVPPEWPQKHPKGSLLRLNTFNDLIKVFEQSPVDELFVNGHDAQEIDQGAWGYALTVFSDLKRIKIDHTDSLTEFDARLSLLEALQPAKRRRMQPRGDLQLTVPSPQLESLVFTSSADRKEDGEFSSTLSHCLKIRKERGCPLKHLHLYLDYSARPECEEEAASVNASRVETYRNALYETVENLQLEVFNEYHRTRSSRLWYYEGHL
ncbi:hypothetical protein FKP32DRAFT_1632211 [Trametes sanguinea]|nr:hypothetical protein FKP32DRAFT_1632211 [Trametes sanguinea]